VPDEFRNKLATPVDAKDDHVLGPANAEITLVEYGSYACPHCRTANETISDLRDQLGDRMRYVFRHRPLRHGPSHPALRALDAIHDRLESPADRLLRQLAPRSSYVVLPVFALANAGVALSSSVLHGNGLLILGIVGGLVVGKPLGMVLASLLAVSAGWATKPPEYSWRQLVGAGCLAGIGFTMSLFIAAQALPIPTEFAAAKIGIFAASIAAAVIGVATLWNADRDAQAQRGRGPSEPSFTMR
jgi:Na+/H+ antiporter NhaA